MKLFETFDTTEEAQARKDLYGTGLILTDPQGEGFILKYSAENCDGDALRFWLETALGKKYATVYGWSGHAEVTVGTGYDPKSPVFHVTKQKNGTYIVSSVDRDSGDRNVTAICANEDKLLDFLKGEARTYFGL